MGQQFACERRSGDPGALWNSDGVLCSSGRGGRDDMGVCTIQRQAGNQAVCRLVELPGNFCKRSEEGCVMAVTCGEQAQLLAVYFQRDPKRVVY